MKHKKVNIDTLYYGFPVFLLSSIDNNGTTNIAPITSSWSLGENIVIGLGTDSKTYENLKFIPEAVINLPDAKLYKNVEKIAPYSGKEILKSEKLNLGYTYSKEKIELSEFTLEKSKDVRPLKIKECPIQIEVKVSNINIRDWYAIIELKVLSVYAVENILDVENYIDSEKWKPLIYSFRKYYEIGSSIGKNFRFKEK